MDHKKTYRKIMQIIAKLENKNGVTITLPEKITKIKNAINISDVINEATKYYDLSKTDVLIMIQAAKNCGDFYEIKKRILKRL